MTVRTSPKAGGLAALENISEIAKEPRAAQAAPTNDHPIAAGFAHHPQCVPGLPDIAVSKDGDARDRLLELGNRIPICLAGIERCCGAGMKGHRRTSLVFGDASRVEEGE
jgi:hypothetical protein